MFLGVAMLSIVSVASLIGAGACIVYGFIAMIREGDLEKKVKSAVEDATQTGTQATAAVKADGAGLAGGVTPQAALSGLGEYLKGLSALAESLSKLKQGVAALLLALAFVTFAGVAAGVEEKVEGAAKDTPTSTSTTSP
jgi:hypothetical protein